MNYRENIEVTIRENLEDIDFDMSGGDTLYKALSNPIEYYMNFALKELEWCELDEDMKVSLRIDCGTDRLTVGRFDLISHMNWCARKITGITPGYEDSKDVDILIEFRQEMMSIIKGIDEYLESLDGRDSQAHEKAQG